MFARTAYPASSSSLIVGAIDFGTTFSGWAYSFMHDFKSDATNAKVKHWISGSGALVTEKTPTCALISPDGKTLEEFGYDAENKYRDLVEKGQHWDYYYFRKFKMKLNKETISRDLLIEDEMGKRFKAIDVISMSIAWLVDDMVTAGGKTVASGLDKHDFHIVLTVPAIWSDAAKQFMREAAIKKPASIKPEKLSIALEPEAASIYCRNLSVQNVEGMDTISQLPAGTKYMILDAGGGTVDITVHEITPDGRLKEVYHASGGGWGGILVDEAFKKLLIAVVGKQVYTKFVKEETEDWLDLWRLFEIKKKTIDPTKNTKINIQLPHSLMELYETEMGQTLQDATAKSNFASTIQFAGGNKARYDSHLMQELFSESVEKTLTHVISILRNVNCRDIKAILMVGGFSESPMLQEAMKKEFSHIKIIIPQETVSAVLRGAVIFGHSPDSISQRVLKKTYGIQATREFDETLHDQKHKIVRAEQTLCEKLFDKHGEKGKAVKVGEAQMERQYYPLYPNQENIIFPIYVSDRRAPRYTDQDCELLGELTVDISNVPGDLDRRVWVSLTFSDTEIKATGKVDETGQIVTATFDCLG